jgi:two-component system cell cycle response regulator DivK
MRGVLWTKKSFSAIIPSSMLGAWALQPAPEMNTVSEKKDLRVLYIEDDPPNRILVKRVLEAEGYGVLEADSGDQGLRVARIGRPAIILVDINMPDMDGYEVTARLRAMPELATVPIIAITANVMKGDREKTLAAGCSGYIQKPIDVDLLPVQVAAFLRR